MKNIRLDSDEAIRRLLRHLPVGGKRKGNGFYRPICRELVQQFGLQADIEWDHYGCGYASFIAASFYRTTPTLQQLLRDSHHEPADISILFCRLAPVFAFWQGRVKGSLPCFESVDALSSPANVALAQHIEPCLLQQGLARLRKDDVSKVLPACYQDQINTNTGDPPYRLFDALFHWFD